MVGKRTLRTQGSLKMRCRHGDMVADNILCAKNYLKIVSGERKCGKLSISM